MQLNIPETVTSPQDVQALQMDIRTYAKWYSHVSIKARVENEAAPQPPALSVEAIQVIRDWSTGHALTTESIDDLIKALDDYLRIAPVLTITLAAPPAAGLKKTLTVWCRQNLASHALIRFKFNATILGGMVVQCGSHIYDWSFRRQLLDARGNFAEVLRRV